VKVRIKLGPAATLRIRLDSFTFTMQRTGEPQKRRVKGVGRHQLSCRENYKAEISE